MVNTIKKVRKTKIPYAEQVLGAMNVAKEWLGELIQIELLDEDRAVKAIQVAHKLSAQLSVLTLRKHNKSNTKIAEELPNTTLDSHYVVENRAIDRYALADQLPEPITVARLYTKLKQDVKGIEERADRIETVELVVAENFKQRLSSRYKRKLCPSYYR